jgi:hypothetical protein
MDVKSFIDLHVHIGPEVLPRKYTVRKIIKEQTGKLRGMALKNHFYPTAPLIKSEGESDLILIGSVTLNNYLGGLNPEAIYASAKLSSKPIIVWFPTINAENFLKRNKYEIPLEWVGRDFKSRLSSEVKGIKIIDTGGELTKETVDVLKVIKDNNCILATGHISWEEAKVLVIEAYKIGIRKIIVTHPIYQLIDMPIEIQKKLSKLDGVYIEQNYAMHSIDKISIEKIAKQIKFIGAKNCIISSDTGQIISPSPNEALEKFTELLKQQGITEKELKIMGEENPRKLLKQNF